MQSTEEGLLQVDELVQTFTHCCSWFIGPFYHLVRVFHPDFIKPLLMAPGRSTPRLLICSWKQIPQNDDLYCIQPPGRCPWCLGFIFEEISYRPFTPYVNVNVVFCLHAASITVKDELIYDHLRPWLGESNISKWNCEEIKMNRKWKLSLINVGSLSINHSLTFRSFIKHRTERVAKQRCWVVTQEAAANSSVSLWYSEGLRCKVQHINKHNACKIHTCVSVTRHSVWLSTQTTSVPKWVHIT